MMAWQTDGPDRLEAVAYTRDYSADSVFQELKDTGGESSSEKAEVINYYAPDDWKVYRIKILIEPVDSLDV